jgi:hypothetical protein
VIAKSQVGEAIASFRARGMSRSMLYLLRIDCPVISDSDHFLLLSMGVSRTVRETFPLRPTVTHICCPAAVHRPHWCCPSAERGYHLHPSSATAVRFPRHERYPSVAEWRAVKRDGH